MKRARSAMPGVLGAATILLSACGGAETVSGSAAPASDAPKPLETSAPASPSTSYFIRATIENVDGTDLAYSTVSLRAIGGDGRSTGVIISGDVDKCESESADKNFTTPGAKYETCVLQASRANGTVGGATFDKGDAYQDDPVVWKN
jgi:hypothetical protein